MTETVPVVVLGAGPAGLSAALWLQHYALTPVVVDPREGGGLQAVSPYANVTLLGHVGSTAREVAARFRAHADSVGVRVVRASCTGIARDGELLRVDLDARAPLACRALVVATGTRFRSLEAPGADEAIARRHLRFIAPDPAFEDARGQDAVVVGGGDNAFYVAGQLAPIARSVTIVVRSRVRAHKAQRTPVLAATNVVVRTGWDVASFEPNAVALRDAAGSVQRVEAAVVYNCVGYVPNTALVKDALGTALDDDGYTDNPKLTGHLQSADFFDVAKFPTARFTSTSIAQGKDGTTTVTGDLTMHGVTQRISFPAQVTQSGDLATATAAFGINRKDFGLVYPGMPDDLIKDEVLLKLDVQARRGSGPRS